MLESKVEDQLMLIGGELVSSESGEWLDSVNPANEEIIGRTPLANAADIAKAVDAAECALPVWAAYLPAERGALLRKLARRLLDRQDQILEIEVKDTGNTIGKMRGDLGAAVSRLEYFAGLGLELKGETIPASNDVLHMTVREPYGVVGRISPFNHPIFFAVSGLAGPLMAGNTVIVKSPEQSPLSAGLLAAACQEVMPPGVVNIVSGIGMVAGDAIVRHPRIRRIAFTGSVPTGLAIQRAAAEVCVKHVSLELGGKNPMILFPDVDPDKAADAAVAGMNFPWQGQSCGSTSRVMVHESIYAAVLQRIVDRIRNLRVGDPLDPQSQMGPINSKRQYERVQQYVEFGKQDGARLVAGGKRPGGSTFSRGYWIEPTAFADATMKMRIAREEIFGPVLSILKWHTIDEAVDLANATEYGLTAAIWTKDIKEAVKLARKIDAGYIWINGTSTHFGGTPFGGMKNSGVGKEECLEELLSYTQTKTIHLSLS